LLMIFSLWIHSAGSSVVVIILLVTNSCMLKRASSVDDSYSSHRSSHAVSALVSIWDVIMSKGSPLQAITT
jgi:hypothetical protein